MIFRPKITFPLLRSHVLYTGIENAIRDKNGIKDSVIRNNMKKRQRKLNRIISTGEPKCELLKREVGCELGRKILDPAGKRTKSVIP